MTEEGGSLTAIPAPKLVVPAQGEEMFPVRLQEWARLKEKIRALKRHRQQWTSFGWALIGIGASAVLSWLPYLLGQEAHTWVPILTIVVGVAATGCGIIAILNTSETTKSIDEAVKEVRVHMHDMESSLTVEQKQQIKALAAIILDD